MKKGMLVFPFLAFLFLSYAASWNNSETMDEPIHIASGVAYIQQGFYDLNPEHPPLAKMVAGLAATWAGVTLPSTPSPLERCKNLKKFIRTFLYHNNPPVLHILRIVRLSMLIFFFLALIGFLMLARAMTTPNKAWLALILFGSQPLVLAHSPLVHTDIPLVCFVLWSFYFAYTFLQRPTWGRALGLGFSVAFMNLSKFTGLFMTFIVVLWLCIFGKIKDAKRWGMIFISGMMAFLVFLMGYTLPLRHHTKAFEKKIIHHYLKERHHSIQASQKLKKLADYSIPLAHYFLGLTTVRIRYTQGQGISYLAGYKKYGSIPLYFPVAFFFKTSFPLLILFLLSFFRKPTREEFWFILFPIGLYFAVSLQSGYNIGARHLLPIYPLVALWASRMNLHRRLTHLFTIITLLVPVVTFPYYISHYNLLLGGRALGKRILVDSNLEWGEQWYRLSRWMQWHHIPTEKTAYCFFGYSDPSYYLQGGMDLFYANKPIEYVIISAHDEAVGVEMLYGVRRYGASKLFQKILELVHKKGKRLYAAGGTLNLYRLPEPIVIEAVR